MAEDSVDDLIEGDAIWGASGADTLGLGRSGPMTGSCYRMRVEDGSDSTWQSGNLRLGVELTCWILCEDEKRDGDEEREDAEEDEDGNEENMLCEIGEAGSSRGHILVQVLLL